MQRAFLYSDSYFCSAVKADDWMIGDWMIG